MTHSRPFESTKYLYFSPRSLVPPKLPICHLRLSISWPRNVRVCFLLLPLIPILTTFRILFPRLLPRYRVPSAAPPTQKARSRLAPLPSRPPSPVVSPYVIAVVSGLALLRASRLTRTKPKQARPKQVEKWCSTAAHERRNSVALPLSLNNPAKKSAPSSPGTVRRPKTTQKDEAF